MKVYLDSCLIIYRVEAVDPYSAAIADAVRSEPAADFCISDLVRLECLVGPMRRADGPLRRLYETQFALLTCLPMHAGVFDRAAELRAATSLKMPDALHVAAAIEHGCDQFWTNDRRLGEHEGLTIRVVASAGP